MQIDPDVPVATIVLDHSECAAVFTRHGIDYCCQGKRPLRAVCGERALDLAGLMAELELAIQRRVDQPVDARTLSTHALITQVIGRHHRYLHRTLPVLEPLAQKVARVHGERDARLVEVARRFRELAAVLAVHLAEEERDLFPALLGDHPEVAVPMLRQMRAEHDEVGRMLHDLRAAAGDYVAPEWACTSYRTLFAELAALEADTLTHVHLENHVLLPRFVPAD